MLVDRYLWVEQEDDVARSWCDRTCVVVVLCVMLCCVVWWRLRRWLLVEKLMKKGKRARPKVGGASQAQATAAEREEGTTND